MHWSINWIISARRAPMSWMNYRSRSSSWGTSGVSPMSPGRGDAAGRVSHSGNRSESSRNREMMKPGMKRGAEGDLTKIIIITTREAEAAITTRMKQGKRLQRLKILDLAAATQSNSSREVAPEKVKTTPGSLRLRWLRLPAQSMHLLIKII